MRRGKIEIIMDILEALKDKKMTKTAIVYQANLNFKRANIYLDMLIKMGMVERISNEYNITELGKKYLTSIKELNSLFNE